MKYIILFSVLLFSGCSHFKVNATMCDQIRQDPNAINIPAECRDYSEEDAAKASLPPEDEGECIECQKPEKLEYTP